VSEGPLKKKVRGSRHGISVRRAVEEHVYDSAFLADRDVVSLDICKRLKLFLIFI